jgi:hypothetical protein
MDYYKLKVSNRTSMLQKVFFKSGQRLSMWSLVLNIWKKEGILGFYRGIKSDYLKIIFSNTIFMLIFEKIRNYFGNSIH